MTGTREGVDFRSTRFLYLPPLGRVCLLLCGLVGVIIALATLRGASIDLPMTARARARWMRVRAVQQWLLWPSVVCLVAGLVPVFVPSLRLFGAATLTLALLSLGTAGVIAAGVYFWRVVRPAGPICTSIDGDWVELSIPSDLAAEAFAPPTTRTGPGRSRETDDEQAKYDALIDAELDRM